MEKDENKKGILEDSNIFNKEIDNKTSNVKETTKNKREYRKSCVNKSFRDKIKNIKEGLFYG